MADLVVWKWPIPAEARFSIEMPKDARLLHVDVQRMEACLWALVDPDAGTEMRHFQLVGTGHREVASADAHRHVGSVLLADGALVFHLFETRP